MLFSPLRMMVFVMRSLVLVVFATSNPAVFSACPTFDPKPLVKPPL